MSTFTIEFKKHFAIVSWKGGECGERELSGAPEGSIHIRTEDPLSSSLEARDQAELNLYRLRQVLNNLKGGDREYCTVIDEREEGK